MTSRYMSHFDAYRVSSRDSPLDFENNNALCNWICNPSTHDLPHMSQHPLGYSPESKDSK